MNSDLKSLEILRVLEGRARLKGAESFVKRLSETGCWFQADYLYQARKRVLRRRRFVATRRYRYPRGSR